MLILLIQERKIMNSVIVILLIAAILACYVTLYHENKPIREITSADTKEFFGNFVVYTLLGGLVWLLYMTMFVF